MDFLTRINAVLHGDMADRIPFAPYDNLVPRGSFGRELRNRGMGLCKRISTISSSMPNVVIEHRHDRGTLLTTYRTPVGKVSTRTQWQSGRVIDGHMAQIEGMIKDVKDYEPVIFMLDDTEFHLDPHKYHNAVFDMGRDGIIRDQALDHEAAPYGATRRYFGEISGLDRWIYAQKDHPDHFAALVAAQTRRDERRLELILQSPAKFLGLGWLEGLWSPEHFMTYEFPFYKKWVSRLQNNGKICALHCDATKSMKKYKDPIAKVGFKVIEAYTPPPVGEVSLPEVRQAWGADTIIWINFPETIFYHGADFAHQFTIDLIKSDPPGNALVLGFTEMGIWGATDPETEEIFKRGTMAIMDAIEAQGNLPIKGI
jgi:hypothetical protein